MGAVVPLQVADPEHQLGDGGGPGVELDAEELVRVDGVAVEAEGGLRLAHLLEEVGDFAFEALHRFEGDVEEVAGAAGGVEDAGGAELAVEGVQGGAGLRLAGRRRRGGGRRRGRSPSRRAGARRGWGGRGARRRGGGCSGRRACGGRGCSRARSRRVPKIAGSTSRQSALAASMSSAELDVVDRQRLGVGEEAAVELQHVAVRSTSDMPPASIDGPERLQQGGDVLGGAALRLQQVAEAVLGDEADVLGEHGEQAAHQEAGDLVGGVALRPRRRGRGRRGGRRSRG